MNVFDAYRYSDQEIESRVSKILSGIKNPHPGLLQRKAIMSLIDLTSLNGDDTQKKIRDLCHRALHFSQQITPLNIPAVCIYPVYISCARKHLKGYPVRIATVAGGFPSGQVSVEVKVCEVKYALDEGADEIDLVINRANILEGNDARVLEEISVVREECHDRTLKVILETGELRDVSLIRKACELALVGGADFLKTSTGKSSPAATLPAFLVMLDTIREYCMKTGIKAGIKAAGGIAEPEIAFGYYSMVQQVLGESWLSPEKFRIGASRLAAALNLELS